MRHRKLLGSVAVILVLAVGATVLVFGAGEPEIEEFPTRDIEFIVMYGAGGSADQFARAIQPGLEEALGVSVVVRNVTGGGGAVGFTEALTAAADGYTITIPNNALFTLQGLGHVDFSYDDFDTIARAIVEDYVLTAGGPSGIESLEEFVEYAKANPGEVEIGHAGVGSSTHIASVAMVDFLDLDVEFVPFDGGAASTTAAMGGHVHAVVQHPAEIISGVEGGDLIPLASMGDAPPVAFPDIPTMKDEGFDLSIVQWRGIGLPKGVDEEIHEIYLDAIRQAVERDDFRNAIEEGMLATIDPIFGLADTMAFMDHMAGIFVPIAEAFAD